MQSGVCDALKHHRQRKRIQTLCCGMGRGCARGCLAGGMRLCWWSPMDYLGSWGCRTCMFSKDVVPGLFGTMSALWVLCTL